jgi:hypothetical protein
MGRQEFIEIYPGKSIPFQGVCFSVRRKGDGITWESRYATMHTRLQTLGLVGDGTTKLPGHVTTAFGLQEAGISASIFRALYFIYSWGAVRLILARRARGFERKDSSY